jgi:phage/plasmid-like protein (TIGR03299 family)
MAHNIDQSNGRDNFAFRGDRNDIWHRLGTQILDTDTAEEIQAKAGLLWEAVKVPLWANISGLGLTGTDGNPLRGIKIPQVAIVRSDTGAALGVATDTYQPHQPQEIFDWFKRYLSVDKRFVLDTAGSLKGGQIIWAQAKFSNDMTIAGDKHAARLLMTTSFDTTAATINKATLCRVVCNNTLDAAVADGGKSVVRTRHNTKFDPAKVGAELARIAEGFDTYKGMAEAMAKTELSLGETANFFKAVLDIPFDVKQDEVSARKLNQFSALNAAYQQTLREGTQPKTAWTALNAVTRYVDHSKTTRGGASSDEARVLSSQFGSGAALKAKAVQLLIGRNGETIEQEIDAPDAPRSNLDAVLDMMGA